MNPTRLFVGNLSYQTMENDLQDYFSQVGAVTSVNLMLDKMTGKSRGFAFVEMGTQEEAEAAIQALNGKDVETRQQVHVIKECLSKLAVEFSRFDERMRDLARHIKQAHEDVEKVQITSSKISQRFSQIEGVDLGEIEQAATPLRVVEFRDDSKG